MTIEVSLLAGIVSVAFAIFFGLKSNRRNDIKDIEEKVARDTTLNIKLDDISGDVKDIKYEMSETKRKVNELDIKFAKVEQSVKSAHHRIDKIEGKERITGNESLQSKEDPRHAAGNLPHTKHPGISPGCDHSAALPYLCTSSIKPMMIGIASVWWLAFMASIYLDRFS